MGTIDIIILICFVPAIIQGVRKGFIEQVTGLISLVLGVWLALRFSTVTGEWLSASLSLKGNLPGILSFILIVIVTAIVLNLLGKMIARVLKMAMLGWVNNVLGLVFSLMKAFIIVGLVIVIFDSLNVNLTLVDKSTLDSSTLYCTIRDVCLSVFPKLKNLILHG